MPARPACLLATLLLGFVVGVAVQLQQAQLFDTSSYAALTLAAMLGLCWAGRFGRRFLAAFCLAFVLSGGLGFGLTGLRAVSFAQSALNPALEGQDIEVTGQIAAMPQFSEDGVRFRFAVASARLNSEKVILPPYIQLGWYAGFGARTNRLVAIAEGEPEPPEFSLELQRQPQPLRAGENWQMTVRLKAPHGNSNPHGFDYELWLWEQGIQATGYVRTGKSDSPPKKLAFTWAKPIERARQTVREAIFERVDNRQVAGVLAALVVGDQNAIERADWDVFRATGVAHLMSISGLHITMFAWAASLAIGWLWRRSTRLTPKLCLAVPAGSAGALGGLALATLYALFSGWGVPAQRTIWMLASVVLLRQSGKQWPWPIVWLLAMAVVVALDPWALMQPGFWLSFVAVGVLFASSTAAITTAEKTKHNAINKGAVSANITLAGDLNDTESRLKKYVLISGVASVASYFATAARQQWVITLALTPLSLLLFNQVSVIGLLANAVAIPWVTLVVTPLAMAGSLFSPAWDAAALAVSVLTVLLKWLASFSWASLTVAAAPFWCAAAGVLGGILLAMRLPLHWRVLGVPLLLPVLLWQPLRPETGQFEVLGADIGQGNALIVRTSGHSLVYDTGPKFSRESDAGNRVLVPLLRAMGEKIDLLMLSHRDLDHIGGAPAVLAMQPEAKLLSSIEDSHELQAVRKSERCVAGQSWRWDGVDFEVLHPLASDYDSSAKSNAMSCVLRISNGAKTALLAGDLEAAQELRLVGNPKMNLKLKADFLLVPHHGSKTSSTGPFLDAVQPQFALAQAGYRNRFNHPVESVLQRYADRQIRVVKSPVCGSATWRSAQADEVLCQRRQAMRYWHHQLDGLNKVTPFEAVK